MSLVVGLTGGIATGKSTVSRMFSDWMVPVIDADLIARQVVEPGEPAYKEIVCEFGEGILFANGKIDRKKLGEIVFSNEKKRQQLNNIVHPAVRKKMLSQRDELIAGEKKVIVLDIPLLFESKLTDFVDRVVVVYVTEEIQLSRLMERDGSAREEALKRINAQMPIEEKARLADEVIDNSRTKKETEQQAKSLLLAWEKMA